MAEEATKQAAGETKGATERATNCASCNKRLSRKKQYYRNGSYFCNKRCWKTAAAKTVKAEANAPADSHAEAKAPAAPKAAANAETESKA